MIADLCGLALNNEKLEGMLSHPSISKYSKDLSRPYDANSRTSEITELERCWSTEADIGMEWAARHAWPGLDVFATTLAQEQTIAAAS